MIPKPFVFKDVHIEAALDRYREEMPNHLAEFEKENGAAEVRIIAIYPSGYDHIVVATIWQDKVRMEAMAASKKITDGGSDLLNKLTSQMTQAFNAEGCKHDEYESLTDASGNTKIVCKRCGTPLA